MLVVDDEPAFARLTRDYLERELADVEVLVEHRARAALDRIEDADVDCVVSDHEMPGRTGIEFLEELRERHPDLPFVLFTGEGSEAVASDAISAGVTDYLQKGGSERFELLANRVETAVEKHRAETELDRSEDRYRTLVELAPVPIVVHQGMEVAYANQRAVEFLGADDRSRILGRSPLEFVAPDYRETIAERVQSVLATGEPAELMELPMRDVDGERRLGLITGARICYDGDPAVLTVARDITERKRMERRFRALIEHSPVMTTVLDPDGTVRYASPANEDVLGYEVDVLDGTNVFDVVHPEDEDVVRDAIRDVVDDPGRVVTVRHRYKHADGEWRWIESHGKNRIDDPSVEGIVVSSQDITERVEQERELRRQNDRLDEFASVVSHDLRNPLQVASGNVEMALESGDSEPLTRALDALDRMDEMIDATLALARQGEVVDDPAPVNLDRVLEAVTATTVTDDADVEVGDLPTVEGDPERVRALFANLLSNAVEHGSTDRRSHGPAGVVEEGSVDARSGGTNDAGAAVTVRVGATDAGVYVADDGPGIPPEDRDRVFESGYSTDAGGTGFGLSIVWQIAAAHGWTVDVAESESGGARFEIAGIDEI